MKTIEPISFYKTEKGLQFYLIDCGSGLTHLIIFPDDTVMLFDCNLIEDNSAADGLNTEQILNFFKKVIPAKKKAEEGTVFQPIDIFVNSHRDTDHLKGLKEINSQFPIQSIWDSGCTGENPDNADYKYYMGLRRRLPEGNVKVPTPTNICIKEIDGAKIYCLADAKDYRDSIGLEAFRESSDKKQHTNCMVLLITYAGRKMLLTGDSGWESWRDKIVPNFKGKTGSYENTDILIASHHGSRSFFTSADTINEEENPDNTFTEHLKQIKPKITLISCGNYDYKDYHLPNDEAVKLYKKYTSNEQVYTTYNKGTFCVQIKSDGSFSVTPYRFHNINNINGHRIKIVCYDDENNKIENNSLCRINRNLRFKVINEVGSLLSSSDSITVTWEVCNSGYGKDSAHHEIYKKDKNEPEDKFSFKRELYYVGTHLLRCYVKNQRKGCQTCVFVINGIE